MRPWEASCASALGYTRNERWHDSVAALPFLGSVFCSSWAGLYSPAALAAQEPLPPSVRTGSLVEDSIRLDGTLDEPSFSPIAQAL